MAHEFVPPFFLGSCEPEEADIALFGVCWDGTSSFKAGSRFAGFAVREASFGMEEFSFYQQASLLDIKYADYGDLFLPPGQKARVLDDIGSAVREIRGKGQFPLAFGGEHLLAYPLIMEAHADHPDLAVVHFDAHADLRPDLWGDEWTHATILGRVADRIGYGNLKQFGIRSGSKEEWDLARAHDTLRPFTVEALRAHLDSLGDRPIYLTLDMDVLDPSLYPGTGTPEPGGITWDLLIAGLKLFKGRRLVGMDCLELAPHYDPTGVSAITMAKTLRELIILASGRMR
ncbi:agmatinase [Geothrix rubra]|uniref:Agmatinase n=1 Tax=Geothrix rubra TaxID=2927977 RepID=A0ABQ5Q9D6_9BACT|nr:agmatinase [Geothrix rubra]GLH70961.1 agmatinase [Geothrix rubra]